jgi:hypothetical protein
MARERIRAARCFVGTQIKILASECIVKISESSTTFVRYEKLRLHTQSISGIFLTKQREARA